MNRADLEESVSPRENTRQSTLKNSMSIYGIYDPQTRQHIPFDQHQNMLQRQSPHFASSGFNCQQLYGSEQPAQAQPNEITLELKTISEADKTTLQSNEPSRQVGLNSKYKSQLPSQNEGMSQVIGTPRLLQTASAARIQSEACGAAEMHLKNIAKKETFS